MVLVHNAGIAYIIRTETPLDSGSFQRSEAMRNNHPKSENPAMKEHAALDKSLLARQKTTEAEKAAHAAHTGHAHGPEVKPKTEVPKPQG